MLAQTVLAVVLLATDTAVPSPQPSIPTIVRVHSSPYCTALHKTVDPALVGLMHNDALITVGRSAMLTMDHDVKYGGELVSSWGSQGPATITQLPGKVKLFDNQLKETATALAHNVSVIDTILANADTTLKPSNADEQASLGSIKTQLGKIADQQKTAISVLSGTADTQELDELFNGAASVAPAYAVMPETAHSDTLDGVSPLGAVLSKGEPALGVAGDPALAISTKKAQAQASRPLHSQYEPLINALTDDQLLIGSYEDAASKTIVAGAAGCK